MGWWLPAILGCLIEICVPFENKVAHLIGIYLLCTYRIDDSVIRVWQLTLRVNSYGNGVVRHFYVYRYFDCLGAHKGTKQFSSIIPDFDSSH